VEVGGEEVTGELRKLHNEELHDFYSSSHCLGDEERIRLLRHVAGMWEKRNFGGGT
jgi:hypothetical protein